MVKVTTTHETMLGGYMLKSAEVARRLRVNQSTLSRWRFEGLGPRFIKVGGLYRYPSDLLELWISQATERSTNAGSV